MGSPFSAKDENIRLYMFLRLILLFSLLASLISYQRTDVLDQSVVISTYGVTFVNFFLTSFFIFFFESVRNISYFLKSQIIFDILFTTLIIFYTGPLESLYTVFYVFNIIFASIVMGKYGSIGASILSTALYLLITWVNLPTLTSEKFFSVATNATAFIAIGVLSGQLLDELSKSRSQITKLAQINKEMELRQDRLAGIAQLAAGVAHEIRNPIASISGASQLLIETQPGEEHDRLLAIIQKECGRIDRLVVGLLDFAKLRARKIEKISLPDLVRESVETLLLQENYSHVKVAINVENGDKLSMISGDKDQIRELINNLAVNAFQAVADLANGMVEFGIQKKGKMIELTVKDNGPGIPPEYHEKVFDPFFTTKPTGVGLGLAQVHKISKEHDALLELHSSHGKGTLLSIRFPSASAKKESA